MGFVDLMGYKGRGPLYLLPLYLIFAPRYQVRTPYKTEILLKETTNQYNLWALNLYRVYTGYARGALLRAHARGACNYPIGVGLRMVQGF